MYENEDGEWIIVDDFEDLVDGRKYLFEWSEKIENFEVVYSKIGLKILEIRLAVQYIDLLFNNQILFLNRQSQLSVW